MWLQKTIIFAISVLVGIGTIIVFSKIFDVSGTVGITGVIANENAEASTKSANRPVFKTQSTGSLDDGDAVVDLKPKASKDGKLVVSLSANTHSVDLGQFDLSKITTLEYQGKVFRPVRASRIGGHHTRSKIVFDIGEDITSFKIIIRGIPNIQERVYEWHEG
jgi:hypothetical protein